MGNTFLENNKNECFKISTWLLTRNDFFRKIDNLQNEVAGGLQDLSQLEVLKAASVNPAAFIGVVWFITFYSLVIKYRKKSAKHARYMPTTALILLSPTLADLLLLTLA
jgi:hypothetical protein